MCGGRLDAVDGAPMSLNFGTFFLYVTQTGLKIFDGSVRFTQFNIES